MGLSLTRKILQSHMLHGRISADETIAIGVDQTLCHDLTGIMAALMLESIHADRVRTEAFFYCDHNTLATSPENSEDHLYLRTAAQRFGIYFSKPGNGICHLLHLQRFAKPGQVMLGADSHTPTAGAMGTLAIGSGGLSVAKAMLGEGFKLKPPKVIHMKLHGSLRPGVSAKDVALEALRIMTVKGAIGAVLEFGGDGIQCLSVPQRATLANMSIELGATTGIFPSDTITRRFLKAQGREQDWIELLPDSDADYDKTIDIDLDRLEPMVAKPHMPDLVVAARQAGDVEVDSVFIGSCTNASYSDIWKAARILKGRKICKTIDLTVAPGSRQVLQQLVRDGILADLVQSGARILECACGPCIGVGQVPGANRIAVRTSNRNFQGRCGNNDAFVYLAGPETAAATALTGKITDPRDIYAVQSLGECHEPPAYVIDDSLFIPPAETAAPEKVSLVRGANIAPMPERGPLRPVIRAAVVIKLGDNVTTDDIIPGGSHILKYIANMPRFSEFTFCYLDPTFVHRARKLTHSVIVGGENYGQGSSREQAALLPMLLGIEVLLAKSFARIHKENLINYGILPLIFENKDDYDKLAGDDLLLLEDVHSQVDEGRFTIKVPSRNFEFRALLEVSGFDKEVLKLGGAFNYLRKKLERDCENQPQR